MKCILCHKEDITLIGEIKSSYTWIQMGEDFKFKVYDCDTCKTRFVSPYIVEKELYEFIFSETDIYISHLDFALKVRKFDDPSWALLNLGHPYYGVLEFLKGKKDLEILDVGCSYGSLCFIMSLIGHKTIGIDISRRAIQFAKGIFGDAFYEVGIEELIRDNPTIKFNLITAVEVIEHISNPMEFIKNCLSLLRGGGSLLITTPNKDYKHYSKDRKDREVRENKIWFFDQPPVHLAIYGEDSMRYIAKENNCKIEFITCPGLSQITGNLNLIAVFTKI